MKLRSREIGKENIVGANIVRIRNEKRIKQKDLLAQLQVRGFSMSATSLSRLEGQHRKAYDREILAIAEILNVDIKDLFIKNDYS